MAVPMNSVTRLGEGGANAFYIAAVLGHADVRTSEIYTIATNEGLRGAMESRVSVAEGSPCLSPAATKTAAGQRGCKSLNMLVAGGET